MFNFPKILISYIIKRKKCFTKYIVSLYYVTFKPSVLVFNVCKGINKAVSVHKTEDTYKFTAEVND